MALWPTMAWPYGMPGKIRMSRLLSYLEKALDHFYPLAEPILNDFQFSNIVDTEPFKKLMQKHFPDK